MKLDCDLHAPLSEAQSLIESSRCYFCHDAPCITACPTGINIPQFIRKISTGAVMSAAKDILSENILGGTCARVCPVETLCQEACVRNKAEDRPVEIGLLQRYATDAYFDKHKTFGERAAASGKKVAIVGAGPAGLACAHRLSTLGHECVIFDAKPKPGGLNEYGLAPYKMVEDWAQLEVAHIVALGGIQMQLGAALGEAITLSDLTNKFDAVFLGIGLGDVNHLGIPGEKEPHVFDAVSFIEKIRQTPKEARVGKSVIVVGGGSTAIDIAVESKLLGAQDVTIAYRRGIEDMRATVVERELAQTQGVKIIPFAKPIKISQGKFEFEREGRAETLECDQVFLAIGQTLVQSALGPDVEVRGGKIMIDANYMTTLKGVFAGGDCVNGGSLTVKAVQDGKLAAVAVDRFLKGLK